MGHSWPAGRILPPYPQCGRLQRENCSPGVSGTSAGPNGRDDASLSDRRTYTRYMAFKGHLDIADIATSLALTPRAWKRCRGNSDHMPILVTAEYS